jgi:hypothetical protein
MTMSSWPYVAQDVTDIEYSRLFREFRNNGVVGSLGDSTLKAFGDSSGMHVKVPSGSALIRGYMFMSTAQETIPLVASEAQARVDRLVLELNVAAPLVADRIVMKVLKGTAGSSSAPSVTQTDTGIYQLSMALINVDASASSIAGNKVLDDRDFVGGDTGRWINNDKRPSNPRKYQMGFNEAAGVWEYYNGSQWVNLIGATTWASITGKPSSYPTTPSDFTGILPESKGGTGQDDLDSVTVGNALKVGGRTIYVQSSQPSGGAVGDLWFW